MKQDQQIEQCWRKMKNESDWTLAKVHFKTYAVAVIAAKTYQQNLWFLVVSPWRPQVSPWCLTVTNLPATLLSKIDHNFDLNSEIAAQHWNVRGCPPCFYECFSRVYSLRIRTGL